MCHGIPETHSLSRCCSRWTCRGHCRHDCWMWLLSHSERLETPLDEKKGKHCNQCCTENNQSIESFRKRFFILLTDNHEEATPAMIAFSRLPRWVQRRRHSLSWGAVIWSLLECFPIVTRVSELKYSNNYLAYLNSQNSVLTSFSKKNTLFLFPLPA